MIRIANLSRSILMAFLVLFVNGGFLFTVESSGMEKAETLLREHGIEGGLIVHLGCGGGQFTAALRIDDRFIVQGLDRDSAKVEDARKSIRSQNLYGKVTADCLKGEQLPYIDNVVNLLVVENSYAVPREEILRVLRPEGIALIKQDKKWIKMVKPRPDEIDDWTHYLHNPTGNPVSKDTVVDPPKHLQWVGSPRWSRHHDHMSSLSALVSEKGRIFYIMDEGPTASIELPSDWKLIARDAFNGKILWKQPIERWQTQLWPLKSGPAQLPRRLVADGDKVYVTLGIDAPVSQLDAGSGEILQKYKGTDGAEEILFVDGVLYLLVNPAPEEKNYQKIQEIRRMYNQKYWDEKPRLLKALDADTGKTLWTFDSHILPMTLAADHENVYFHDGEKVMCLSRSAGIERWHSEPIARSGEILSFFAPTLIVHDDVVLFAGGERAGQQRGEWYTEGIDTMTALSTADGKVLWKAYHPPSGYRSPEDTFVINDLVWTGETTSGRVLGMFRGRDLHTGEVKREFIPDVETYWFHHRCYRSKATEKYLMTSRTGIEFIDPQAKNWDIHHWVRGACLYGIMPANGLVYAPPHPCACYLDAKLCGFNALAPSRSSMQIPDKISVDERFEKGPAYGTIRETQSDLNDAWPTYRGDAARSGFTSSEISTNLQKSWETEIGGKLTSVVVAEGKLFVASINEHTVYALDAESGETAWSYTAGGRVDSPPTIDQGRVLFGAADGWVYCLRAVDGVLAWRFRAAPMDRRLLSYEQIESVWPVHGSVLVQDGVLYCVAGRSMFLDEGLRMCRLDPKTGRLLSETVLDEEDSQTGKTLQDYISWLNMPAALPDVLSSDGRLIYMRSQPYEMDGTRLPLKAYPMSEDADRGAPPAVQNSEHAHLFCPTGFLDDTWWHRTYWLYGSTFISGWCGYYRAGQTAPAGRVLAFDAENVYGFGRKPKYYRWTTPLEYQFYAAKKTPKLVKTSDRKGNAEQNQAVDYLWEREVPLLVRAIVKANDTVFIAGPPDLVDEEKVLLQLDEKKTNEMLNEQAAALQGKKGAILWAVQASDGNKLSEIRLESLPVFDGMAGAEGGLYIASQDGKVLCYARKQ